jgi:hypothetical protein
MDDRKIDPCRYSEAVERNPEIERWVHVGFSAITIIGLPADQQDIFLRFLLKDWFADVPDGLPSPDDTTDAFARSAVKLLLEGLLDDGSDGGRLRAAKAMTDEAMRPKREPNARPPKPRLVSDNGPPRPA